MSGLYRQEANEAFIFDLMSLDDVEIEGGTWSAFYLRGMMALFGGGGGGRGAVKSRSLDDLEAASAGATDEARNKGAHNKAAKRPKLKEAGRSNTYEDRTATRGEEEEEQEDEDLVMEYEPNDEDEEEEEEEFDEMEGRRILLSNWIYVIMISLN